MSHLSSSERLLLNELIGGNPSAGPWSGKTQTKQTPTSIPTLSSSSLEDPTLRMLEPSIGLLVPTEKRSVSTLTSSSVPPDCIESDAGSITKKIRSDLNEVPEDHLKLLTNLPSESRKRLPCSTLLNSQVSTSSPSQMSLLSGPTESCLCVCPGSVRRTLSSLSLERIPVSLYLDQVTQGKHNGRCLNLNGRFLFPTKTTSDTFQLPSMMGSCSTTSASAIGQENPLSTLSTTKKTEVSIADTSAPTSQLRRTKSLRPTKLSRMSSLSMSSEPSGDASQDSSLLQARLRELDQMFLPMQKIIEEALKDIPMERLEAIQTQLEQETANPEEEEEDSDSSDYTDSQESSSASSPRSTTMEEA